MTRSLLVDIGEAPKRTGPCFEYSQTVGHRIIQLSEHSIDVEIRVQGRFKRPKISVYYSKTLFEPLQS